MIIVDNGSRTLPEAVVAAWPGVRLVADPQPGPARNRGVALSRAPVIAFADADCRWRGLAAGVLARFAADPGLAALGGDIRVFPAVPGRPAPAEAYEAVYAFRQRLYIETQGYSVPPASRCAAGSSRRSAASSGIGIAGDNDWGNRARRMGHATVYAPGSGSSIRRARRWPRSTPNGTG